MEFKDSQAIYLQIAEHVCDQILRRELNAGDKILSVRDLAISIAVNPNTVVRTYGYLEEQGIIYKQRGIGYFVNEDAFTKTLMLRKNFFLKQELPRLLSSMRLLNINFDDLEKLSEPL
jgi:DNA-binding transcriptional regulator YhcF (GntR family)